MEKPEGLPLALANNRITVPLHPFEIVSVRVDFAPRSKP
jgi:hypothetical protein